MASNTLSGEQGHRCASENLSSQTNLVSCDIAILSNAHKVDAGSKAA